MQQSLTGVPHNRYFEKFPKIYREKLNKFTYQRILRGGSMAAATSKMERFVSKMERFVIIVNGRKPLSTITKRSILDVAAAIYPLLILFSGRKMMQNFPEQHYKQNTSSDCICQLKLSEPTHIEIKQELSSILFHICVQVQTAVHAGTATLSEASIF